MFLALLNEAPVPNPVRRSEYRLRSNLACLSLNRKPPVENISESYPVEKLGSLLGFSWSLKEGCGSLVWLIKFSLVSCCFSNYQPWVTFRLVSGEANARSSTPPRVCLGTPSKSVSEPIHRSLRAAATHQPAPSSRSFRLHPQSPHSLARWVVWQFFPIK